MKIKMKFRCCENIASQRVIYTPLDKEVEKLCLNDIVEIEIKHTNTKILKKVTALELCKIENLYPDCEDEHEVYAIHGIHPKEFPTYNIKTSFNIYQINHERAKNILDKHGKDYLNKRNIIAIVLEEIQ